jgi:hypothetical protein
VHVEKPPGIWLFGSDGLIRTIRVLKIPCIFVEFRGVISKGIGGGGSGTAGIFPLGFGGESVIVTGLSR